MRIMDGHDKDSGDESQTQDGIFSTPDLTVNNLPQTDEENSNHSRITNAFANTDAGQRARKLNDAMGLSSQSVDDDAQIEPKKATKKSSKWPLIFAVIMVIVAVVAVVTFVISGGRSGDDAQTSTQPSTINEAQIAFARYANYMLYGEERDRLEGEYDMTKTYKLDDNLTISDESDIYWNKVIELLNKAVEIYQRNEKPDKSLLDFLETYRQDVGLLNVLHRVNDPTQEQILEGYLASGRDQSLSEFMERYAQLRESSYPTAAEYVDLRSKQIGSMLNLFNIYNEHSCITDGQIGSECVSSLNVEETGSTQLMNDYYEYQQEADDIFNKLLTGIKVECWSINNRFIILMNSSTEEQ